MAAAAVLLTACADTPSQPELIHPTSAPSRVLEGDVYRSSAEIVCDAVVATVTVTCSSKQDTAGSPSHVGGKGMHVRLVTTAPAYNAAGQVFSVKIAVRNLLVQQIGTPDGSTITGIRPFVISLGRSGGTGSIELLNYDSTGTFTEANQPYFIYPTKLATLETSGNRTWQFFVPPTVTGFRFRVYVSAQILPVIVFDREASGNRDIYRVALDGSDLTRLTTNPAADLDPTAAQGFVFFSSYRDGNANLYRLPLFGGTQTRLTTNSANQLEPFVNPEGSRLVFTDDRTGFPKVWSSKVTPATGAIFSTILRTGIDGTAASIEASPTFRPGTLNQIAYVTTELASADIFRKQFPNPATPLINGSAADVEPMYNPAGNQIAFTSNRHGNPEIYLYDIGSGVTTRLTNNAEYDGQPTFLPDGRIVYVGEVGGNRRLKWINPTTMAGGTIITGGVPRNPSYVPLY